MNSKSLSRILFSYLALISFMTIAVEVGAQDRRIVFLAGRASHDYGSHEHLAGSRILAEAIDRTAPGVKCEVYPGGWPQDESVLDGAAAIVMYADGGGGHPALNHLEVLGKHIERGAGFACLHFAVEVPADRGGPEFLKWLGGYFEVNWSVNPHWDADFKAFPTHPGTRGVKPFKANDEWYFHMRFQPDMKGVTPLLSAVPPESTMNRADGSHSGNPTVRKEVAERLPQHVAWAYERADGGRSFGFTGGHYHWNWGREDILKLVCNSICWTARVEVPTDGLKVTHPTFEQLRKGQDEKPRDDFNPEETKQKFQLSGTVAPASSPNQRRNRANSNAKPIWESPVVSTSTAGHKVDVAVDLAGAKKIYLVVNDGGNGFGCDWADWIQPTLHAGDKKLDLTTVNWTSATTDWGQVHKNLNAGGGPLQVAGKSYDKGIGTHANSVISFDVPEGFTKFTATAGLDNGGTNQGDNSSVRFAVYTTQPPTTDSSSSSGGDSRAPEDAVAGLDIAPGVEVTLAASEPQLLSLTNLDIDHKGRVWVCEVVNYRRHNGERPEGDRILILEDSDQDGVMDKSKVYYQGRDVDSAMGICVLGNRVIVSSSPNIWIFTDEDGDDKPDRKELFYSKTGDAQHDHSAHSFLFGPDGKLYWNFGNTGHSVHDAAGNVVIDKAGNRVTEERKPYTNGMAFRSNLDGSEFETLGYNFRNNYEVTVDSFGALWQSDNDDDGNRAVRINYVMEFGNYGYVDVLNGEGWRAPRANMEAEIPQQHWHLNDPGVVPTMLITGAGSPTGITVYEADLLPEAFRNQVLHCDAGPNVVRAYPTKNDGAGYTAEMLNLMVGERDRWFRPADVCVAPDGSVFVTDWYDPGVGGHNMQDMERGRLFRIAPPGKKYEVPKFDFSSAAGAVAALHNPSLSVRYLAWEAIQKQGQLSVAPLKKMAAESNPRIRARALWALGKLPDQGKAAVDMALSDQDANVRMTGIRLARQLNMAVADYASKVVKDSSPQVRRELAIALRFDKSTEMPKLWTALAQQHDGKDRWYLEALGIGADLRADECFATYMTEPTSNAKARRDIVWRSRAAAAATEVAKLLASSDLPEDEVQRMLRTLDFHSKDNSDKAMQTLLASEGSNSPRRDTITVEALLKLNDAKLWQRADLAAAVKRFLDSSKNRAEQLRVLKLLENSDSNSRLIKLAMNAEVDSSSVGAFETLIGRGAEEDVNKALLSDKPEIAIRAGEILALCNGRGVMQLLRATLANKQTIPEVRVSAARGLTRTEPGAKALIDLAREGQLPTETRYVVGSILRTNRNEQIRNEAVELFPAPKTAAKDPLPPLAELVTRKGDVGNGEKLFKTTGTCANCHLVKGQGKSVGPDLSEIGSKLTREALIISIVDPSSGISHNYESYSALTDAGEVVVGLLVSQTENQVTLKDAQGIERVLKKADLEQFKKQEKSLMPENLIETLKTSDLIDIVEYTLTLKK